MSLGTKLKLTQRALGCRSVKELAARFRAANPHTQFEVERARKWLRGSSAPRSPEFYDDWAKVICTARGSVWLTTCSPAALVDELARTLGADPLALEATAAEFEALAAAPGEDAIGGDYVAYSRAFSPYYEDWLVRAHLRIAPRRDGRFNLRYDERLSDVGVISGCGVATVTDDVFACHAESETTGRLSTPFLFLLRLPGPPVNLLFGQLLAVTVYGPVRPLASTPLLALRVEPETAIAAMELMCYVRQTRAAIAAEIRALGFAGDVGNVLVSTLLHVFGPDGPPLSVSPCEEVTTACVALATRNKAST